MGWRRGCVANPVDMIAITCITANHRVSNCGLAFLAACACLAVVATNMNAWSAPQVVVIPFAVLPAASSLAVGFFKTARPFVSILMGVGVAAIGVAGFVTYAASQI